MKIVFGGYPTLFFEQGGLELQIKNSMKALKQEGHNVLYWTEWLNERSEIDIYHHFSVHQSSVGLYDKFSQISKKTVLSPIYQSYLPILYRKLYQLLGNSINFQNYRNIKNIIDKVDRVIYLGNVEKIKLEDFFKVNTSYKYNFIPNGIDLSNEIVQVAEANSRYVVCVGTICRRKNQLELIKACNKLELNLKVIGAPLPNELDYYELCIKEANPNLIEFKGYLDNRTSVFKNIIANSQCFVLPSLSEVLPISVFEALSLNVPVITTHNSALPDYIKNGITYIDTSSYKNIMYSIKEIFETDKFSDESNFVHSNFTWNSVAKNLVNEYTKLLNGK